MDVIIIQTQLRINLKEVKDRLFFSLISIMVSTEDQLRQRKQLPLAAIYFLIFMSILGKRNAQIVYRPFLIRDSTLIKRNKIIVL